MAVSHQKDLWKKTFINIQGEIYQGLEAKIPVLDRGFLYGDSIYEVFLYEEKQLIFMEEHFERLHKSTARIELNYCLEDGFLEQEMHRTADKVGVDNQYIRLIITRGINEISLDVSHCDQAHYVIIARPLRKEPAEAYQSGVDLKIANVRRNPIAALDPAIKSGNYLNNIQAIIEAKKAGAFDAIILNTEGFIAEGPTFNIFMVKKGKIYTPPLRTGILSGITRKILIEEGKKHRYDIIEKSITPLELISADEVFISSTTREVLGVSRVDGNPIGSGKVGQITREFMEILRNKILDYIETKKRK